MCALAAQTAVALADRAVPEAKTEITHVARCAVTGFGVRLANGPKVRRALKVAEMNTARRRVVAFLVCKGGCLQGTKSGIEQHSTFHVSPL